MLITCEWNVSFAATDETRHISKDLPNCWSCRKKRLRFVNLYWAENIKAFHNHYDSNIYNVLK